MGDVLEKPPACSVTAHLAAVFSQHRNPVFFESVSSQTLFTVDRRNSKKAICIISAGFS
jgi:hypothetical protein